MQTQAILMALHILSQSSVFDVWDRLSEQTAYPATCMGRSFKVVEGHPTDCACRMLQCKPLYAEIATQVNMKKGRREIKCLVGVRLECYIYFAYCINNAFSPIPYHCDSAGFEIVHYRDVLMGTMRLKSSAPRLFTQPFIRAQIKENIKAPRHWPLWGEFTGDRWIPRTNGQ